MEYMLRRRSEEEMVREEEYLKKSLGLLSRGGVITGILVAILSISTMMGYLSSVVGLSVTVALTSIFSAFVVERLRLSRK